MPSLVRELVLEDRSMHPVRIVVEDDREDRYATQDLAIEIDRSRRIGRYRRLMGHIYFGIREMIA